MKKLISLNLVLILFLILVSMTFAGDKLIDMKIKYSAKVWNVSVGFYTTNQPNSKKAERVLIDCMNIALMFIDTKNTEIMGSVWWYDSTGNEHPLKLTRSNFLVIKKGSKKIEPFM